MQQLDPVQWVATGKLLADHNLLLSQSFVFMAKFRRQYETKPDSWHAAALHGHSLGKTFFIPEPERRVLKEMQLFSVSQIFKTNDNMTTSEGEKIELFEHLDHYHPSLSNKLKWIRRNLRDTRLTRTPAYPASLTTAHAQIQQDSKLSIKYQKQARQDLYTSIGTAPAYATQQRDGVFYPSPKTFTDAYKVIEIGSMPNKTRETSFQVPNRTVWINRKAYRTGIAENATCNRCEEEETMEQLLYGCKNYSAVVWREFSTLITTTLAHIAGHPVARMDHTPKEIVFNLLHPSIVLYISDPPSRTILLHLVQEIKRDIIHPRVTITSPRGFLPLLRIHAHLLSVINKVASQMDY
jgi:hypothetical protein